MNKVKLTEREAKPEGYVLTKKGLQAAAGRGKWPNSLDDVILRLMVKSPDAPLTKGSLSEDLWQKASEVLARLEGEGLVQKADSNFEVAKPKAVIQEAARVGDMRLPAERKERVQKLTKNVYGDKGRERLARKKHRGWKKVTY